MRTKQNEIALTISKIILILLAFGALATVVAVAPNAFQILKLFQKRDKRLKNKNQASLRSALYRLKKQKLINISEKDGKTLIEITQKGKTRALKYKLEKMKIKKPKRWDKKWRVVIFDIPNNKTLARNVLRDKLKELGFYKLQKSVWIFPYKCRDEIDFIKEIYNIEPYINLILAEKIDQEEKCLKFFNLK